MRLPCRCVQHVSRSLLHSFMERMQKERDAELTALLKRALLSTAQLGVMFASTTVITAATFAIHVSCSHSLSCFDASDQRCTVFHRPLDAATAFGALALFNALRFPLDTFAHMITYLIQASVSIKRIDAFLIEPETTKWDQQEAAPADAPTIGFVNATCSYDLILASPDASIHSKDALPFSLVDLNLDFPLGELSLIIGPVGSGKSTMLLSLLRETHLQVGSAYMPSPITRESTGDPAKGSVEATAYCSQAPWLLSDSIRANILFGHAMVRLPI